MNVSQSTIWNCGLIFHNTGYHTVSTMYLMHRSECSGTIFPVIECRETTWSSSEIQRLHLLTVGGSMCRDASPVDSGCRVVYQVTYYTLCICTNALCTPPFCVWILKGYFANIRIWVPPPPNRDTPNIIDCNATIFLTHLPNLMI